MKKHIIGLALFSFIVSAAAIVYALFNVPEIVSISAPQYIPAKKTHCKMRREFKINSIEIRQAVLNWHTEQFDWELAIPEIDEPIVLHFFSVGHRGTWYIASEKVSNTSHRNGLLQFRSSYDWLDKLQANQSLYVTAQFDSEAVNYSENYQVYDDKFQPKFDTAKAVPVTIDYDK